MSQKVNARRQRRISGTRLKLINAKSILIRLLPPSKVLLIDLSSLVLVMFSSNLSLVQESERSVEIDRRSEDLKCIFQFKTANRNHITMPIWSHLHAYLYTYYKKPWSLSGLHQIHLVGNMTCVFIFFLCTKSFNSIQHVSLTSSYTLHSWLPRAKQQLHGRLCRCCRENELQREATNQVVVTFL